ncbi:MAG: sulfite oxidase [Beijerinckiaceae bacterium]
MTHETERSIHEAFADPERGDAVVFGRRTDASRRGFLGGAGLAAMGAAVGGAIPFSANMPAGFVPAALAQAPAGGTAPVPVPAAPKAPPVFTFPGKDKGLTPLGDRPLVAETPEHLMDDATTPVGRFFVRNNGQIPEEVKNPDAWTMTVDGAVKNKLTLSVGDLKSKFKAQTYRMVMECGGNGRSFFQPQGRGNQWTNGGAGCAEWTGVPLADVLKMAGLNADAKFTGHYGADPHLSGDSNRDAISRGMPIAKALERHSLVVWAMNGQPLTNIHGGPLRLIVPGWPGSLSAKWLKRVLVRKDPHDGQGMGGTSYRIPTIPIIPGSNADGKTNFADMESMPVRGILTSHANGTKLPAGTRKLALRGAAWAGENTVKTVHVSTNFGQRWVTMKLTPARNKYDWSRWEGEVALPSDGYFEIWVRAQDSRGIYQPHIAGNWNPQGYGANPMHRVAVLVG